MSIGLVGLAVALAVGSIGLYAALSAEGLRRVDRSAAASAAEVADLIRTGRLPQTLPVTGVEIVQVLDDRGRVVSASANADRLTAVLRPDEVATAERAPVTVSGSRLGIASQLRVRADRLDVGTESRTVVVAEPVDDLVESSDVLRPWLIVGYPVILLVLGLLAWRVIGAALRPVERLRAAAERISGSERGGRLPVPPGDDEIRALAATLNSMLDRLDRARERERGFVADAAHELRSPLASMRMQIDVARRLGQDGELLDELDADVTRMTGLVEDLLAMARLDAGAVPDGGGGPCGVRDALAAGAARLVAGRLRIEVGPGPEHHVRCERTDLVRVFANLLGNAARYASIARVTLQEQPAWVLVRIDDDGPGIAPAERERAFERFTRLDEARDRDAGGAGLGLAIVREALAAYGGTVNLDDSPLGGLRVELRLPRARAVSAE